MRKSLISAVAVVLVLATGSARGVVINEFYYGTASPGDNEWVELYNRSGSDIDLVNWKIAVANNGPFAQVHTITSGNPDTTIPAAGYFLITDGAGAGLDYDENNVNMNLGRDSGSNVFGIALLDDTATTIDTVLYGPVGASNTFNLRDDDGFTSMSRVKGVTGDQSYTRDDFHTDSNDSSSDFHGSGGAGTPVPVQVSRFELD